MFKLSSNILTDRSKAVLLLWILFVICVSCLSVILSCLFLAALWWLPAGEGYNAVSDLGMYCMPVSPKTRLGLNRLMLTGSDQSGVF